MKNIKSPRLGLKLFYKMIEKIELVYFTFPIIHLRFLASKNQSSTHVWLPRASYM